MRIHLSIAIVALAFACATSSPERTASTVPPAGTNGNQNVYSPPSGPAGAAVTEQRSTSDNQTGVNTITGSVARLDRDHITLDAPSGSVDLKVDSGTQVLRRSGMPLAEGISGLQEGDRVSASYDPSSKHVNSITLFSDQRMPEGINGSAPHMQPKSPGSTDANTQPH
ncbi:MAG TPA: hypothetical protein VLW85_15380 [Myxococcales bacterium]|nr:hypothetical protein [Myxococcales bacterium]